MSISIRSGVFYPDQVRRMQMRVTAGAVCNETLEQRESRARQVLLDENVGRSGAEGFSAPGPITGPVVALLPKLRERAAVLQGSAAEGDRLLERVLIAATINLDTRDEHETLETWLTALLETTASS